MNRRIYERQLYKLIAEYCHLRDDTTDYEAVHNKYDELCELQRKFMQELADAYRHLIFCPEQEVIWEVLVKIAVDDYPTTGQRCAYIQSEDVAHKVNELMWEEFGDLLLDSDTYPEIDNCHDNIYWVVDFMFAGVYTPYWEGWGEYEMTTEMRDWSESALPFG